MVDIFSRKKRSKVMAAIRSKDTRPEKMVRSILHRMGLRFRLHGRGMPGTPDIVLRRHKTVIEVFGCFFHRHPGCRQASTPATNSRFWQKKFAQNVVRDRANRNALRIMGWRTLVVWECELRKPDQLARRLRRAFRPDLQRCVRMTQPKENRRVREELMEPS